jgi:hypothetical protein
MAVPQSPPESGHSDNATITTFGPPFDDTNADIILRSSDRVDFMVYGVILSKASPVFETMFTFPQPATDTRSTPQDLRPIVVLAEHSKILATLLFAIYPPTLPACVGPLSLSDHIDVLDMARKYDMAATSRRFLIDFQASEALRDNHLQAFYAAYRRELREAADIAARESLKHPLVLDAIGGVLQCIDGPFLYMLWKFHRACSAIAVKTISDHKYKWIPNTKRNWWSATPGCCASLSCCCPKVEFWFGPDGSKSVRLSNWSTHPAWGHYVDRAVEALKTHPCSEAITNQAILLPSYQAEMCSGCRKQIAGLSEFSRYLGEEVDRVVSNVREHFYLFKLLADLIPLEGPS